MPVGVCAVRSEMVVFVGMRDRMRVDVTAVKMREGVRVSGADALRSLAIRSERIAMPMPAPR